MEAESTTRRPQPASVRSTTFGTGTLSRTASMICWTTMPSANASYDSTRRWRRTSGAIVVTSSGSTYWRPRTSASAWAASTMLMEARGLTPKVM